MAEIKTIADLNREAERRLSRRARLSQGIRLRLKIGE
jgi:hypothetical protein